MKKTYFIADTHFGDENIIRYEGRPFRNAEEMDQYLIQKWNETVTEEDRIFVLGDVCVYNKEKTKEIIGQLQGEKILILGNHDRDQNRSIKEWEDCGFDSVSEWPVLFEQWYLLSHEPLYITKNMPYANIYGHVHANSIYVDVSRQSFCVCTERTGYAPVSWEEIQRRMKGEE